MDEYSKTKPTRAQLNAQKNIYHVFVRALKLRAQVGLHSHEHVAPQPIQIDLSVAVHEPEIAQSTNIVCYESLTAQIAKTIAGGHIDLVETLAAKIADKIMTDKRILQLHLRIEKPNAIENAQAAGIEIERIQNGYKTNS